MNKQEFKETEIGKIPKEWEVVKMTDVGSIVNGFGFPTEYQGKKDGEYIFVKVSDTNLIGNEKCVLVTKNTIDNKLAKKIGAKIYPPDTIIFPKIGMVIYLRKVRILAKAGTFDNNIMGITPNKDIIDPEFFFYYFLEKIDLTKLCGRTTAPSIRKSEVEKLSISLPPLPEQKRIAEILSTVDHAIEEVDKSIIKTERLKKGLMQELLTKGIGHKEFKETEIGKIPKEWKLLEIKDAVDINKEFRDPRRELSNKKFFYIDIYSIENETGIIKNSREIIGKEAPSRARRQIRYNDVIMSTVRPYLKAFAIIPKLYDGQICSTGFAVLRCKERILPKFLLYILFSKSLVSQFNRLMVGAQYPALNSSQVKKLKIPLPSLPEQKKIAEILSTVDERIKLLKEKKEKLGRVKKGLMNDLLTGRKRVKLEA